MSFFSPAQMRAADKPDLELTAVNGIQSTFYAGDPIPLLFVTVRNLGNAPATPIKIGVKCSKVGSAVSMQFPKAFSDGWPTIHQPPLGPGKDLVIKQAHWPGANTEKWIKGNYKLEVTVDPNNQVPESNEANNKRVVNFSVIDPQVDNFMVSVTPVDYTGPCPKNDIHVANAKIKVLKGHGLIKYQWLTSWDAPGKVPHIYERNFNEGDSFDFGVKSVAQTNFQGWTQVKVIYPKTVLSNKAYYKITCISITPLKKKPVFKKK